MKADALTWPRPRVAAGSPAAARERGESARAARVVLSESCPQAAARRCRSCGDPVGRAPGRGLRSGGGFPAGRPPGPGPGRQADSARACAVLAGDLSRAHAGRRARRPRLPGCPGADADGGPDQRALPPEPGGCRRAGRRAGRDRHVRPARGRRGRVDEAAVRAPVPRAQAFYRKHGFAADGTARSGDRVRKIRMVRGVQHDETDRSHRV